MRTQVFRFTLFVWICLCCGVLNGVSVAENYQDYRTWHLPAGAIVRLGKGEISQGERVVAFSPDGERLAVATAIGVWLYDVKTTRACALLPRERSVWRYPVAFSPDGTKLALGLTDNTVRLLDVATGKNIMLPGHKDDVESVAFSPDGSKLASGSNDNSVKLWEIVTSRTIATLSHTDRVTSVAFSPDGSTLASGSWNTICWIWQSSRSGLGPGTLLGLWCAKDTPYEI